MRTPRGDAEVPLEIGTAAKDGTVVSVRRDPNEGKTLVRAKSGRGAAIEPTCSSRRKKNIKQMIDT